MSTPVPTIETDPFWLNKISILFKSDRLTEFIPVVDHSLEERMNAITRFGLYLTVILVAYKRDFTIAWLFPVILLITYSVYKKYSLMTVEGLSDVENLLTDKEPKPTLNNPFMNPLNFEDPKKKPAPSYFEDNKNSEKIRTEVNDKFRHDLYMGIDDVYEKNNSQRQFYTVPNTSTPSDQEKYLNFMYPGMTSCKSEARDCKINEDLRGRPFIFPNQDQNPSVLDI